MKRTRQPAYEKHFWWREIDLHPWLTFSRSPRSKDDQIRAHGGQVFLTQYIQSAFNYELAGRINNGFEFGCNWIGLPLEQRDLLAVRWPTTPLPGGDGCLHITNPAAPAARADGWTDYMLSSWNLRRNNGELIETFKRLLNELRAHQGIRPRRNEGRRHRPISWLPIELLDIRRFKVRTLNEAERSQVSKAVKAFEASI